jgi:chromatin remodeling complex protein RSC6
MVVDATSETESSGVEGIHAKLLEIQRGQQKLQKSLNKTQKHSNELRTYVFGEGEEDGGEGKKRKRQEPTGFAKPAYLLAALSDFLGLGRNTFMPRADVFKMLHKYIKNNQLQIQGNGRMLTVDAKLSELLGIPEGKVTSFFSLQKYLVKHYGKTAFS